MTPEVTVGIAFGLVMAILEVAVLWQGHSRATGARGPDEYALQPVHVDEFDLPRRPEPGELADFPDTCTVSLHCVRLRLTPLRSPLAR